MPRGIVRFAALVVAASLTTACSGDDDHGRAQPDPATTTSAPTPPTTVAPGAPAEYVEHHRDWVLPGRDYDNSRATRDSTITRANVDTLEVAWEAEMSGALSTVPLVVGEAVVAEDSSGRITSFERDTGEVRWTTGSSGFNIGPFGVAVGDGRVFGVYGSTGVVAVDATTGEELWVREITATPSAGIDIQPVVYDGLVFVSTVPVSTGGI